MRGFDAKVIAYDPYPNETFAKDLGYEYVDLDTLYRESDIISLHCPLTKENTYLINRDSMKKMKDGVMIVNTGRGRLIDTIEDRKSTRLNSSHANISYAVFCLKKKK